MKKTLIILLLGIALGISSTTLINYISNHSWNTWDHTIVLDNSQIIQNIKSKINPGKYDKFEQIYRVLNQQYYHGTGSHHTGTSLDEKTMIESALHGFVDGLDDPHTSYFDIQENSWLNQVLAWDQQFEGIWAVVSRKSDGIQIMEVLKSSPAQLVWIKPLDIIVKINDQSVENLKISEVIKLIRGPKGTTVDITILRNSDQSIKKFTITRDHIDVPSVNRNVITTTWSTVKLWYISVSVFGEDTYQKFKNAITALQRESISGYIIDLRWNGWGLLPTAVDIASHFVPKGNIITTTRYSTFPSETYKSDWREWVDRLLPVVLLVDEYSASASEVLVLALKQNNDATIIGTKTFGKWSIQTIYDFDDGSSLKYTIGRWYAPDDSNIDGIWITPDITTELDIKAYQSSWIDTQLQSAIKYYIK